MNRIGIIGAMDEEVSILKERMQNAKVKVMAGMEFHEGEFDGKDIIVVRSGIGKVNAAVCAQILVDIYHVEALINTGVAGSLRNEINITDLVLSTDALQHDMDATQFGYDYGVIPRMEVSVFKADELLRNTAEKVCAEVLPEIGVYAGRVVSGDQFVASHEKKEWIVKNFDGYCTEMEGAAIAQTAYLNHVPFLIIRAISDKADNSAQMAYDEFEHIAIENTVKLLAGLLHEL